MSVHNVTVFILKLKTHHLWINEYYYIMY